MRQLARVAAKHATRDSTKYTRCARSFRQYHGQRISHAIVMTDALNIHEVIQKSIYLSILSILKLKKDGSAAPPFGAPLVHTSADGRA